MLESGTVVAIKDDLAVIVFQRTSACGKCGLCTTMDDKIVMLTLPNTIHAKLGDMVEVSLEDGQVVKNALRLYGIPLLGLYVGAGVGYLVVDVPKNANAQITMALCSLFVGAMSYFVLYLMDKRKKSKIPQPKMVRVVSSEGDQDHVRIL